MGVSTSSNMSTILSSVSTAIESTASVNQNASNSCAAENSLSGCDITVLGNFSLDSGCSLNYRSTNRVGLEFDADEH